MRFYNHTLLLVLLHGGLQVGGIFGMCFLCKSYMPAYLSSSELALILLLWISISFIITCSIDEYTQKWVTW